MASCLDKMYKDYIDGALRPIFGGLGQKKHGSFVYSAR